jgi:excisionase family DNA binding protein
MENWETVCNPFQNRDFLFPGGWRSSVVPERTAVSEVSRGTGRESVPCGPRCSGALQGPQGSRMSVKEIARRLQIGRLAVYSMLEQGIMPGIRLGRRWIITRHAYEQWERSCGMRVGAGLEIGAATEVMVLN